MTSVVNTYTREVKNNLIAFKFAPNGQSEYLLEQRALIPGWPSPKSLADQPGRLDYKIGEVTKSPSGPGIMLYPQLPYDFWIYKGWFVVHVPKGAALHDGFYMSIPIICVSEVKVIARLDGSPEKDATLGA